MVQKAAWASAHPHDWLVWESGATAAAAVNVGTTQLPDLAAPRPQEGDGLCFELVAAQPKIRIGRAVENDIVIPDATVSREHVVLEQRDGQWTAVALPSSRATTFKVQAKVPADDVPMPLTSGDQLTLGRVRLTYLSAEAMRARIDVERNRLAG